MNSLTVEDVGDVGVPIEAVVEGLADVDIGEEIGRDAIAIQLAGAQIGIAAIRVGNVEVEEQYRARVRPGLPSVSRRRLAVVT